MPMIIIWLGVLIVSVVMEAATYALIAIFIAAGALVALFAAALHAQLWLQIVLFVAVAGVSLAATRRAAKKRKRRAGAAAPDPAAAEAARTLDPVK